MAGFILGKISKSHIIILAVLLVVFTASAKVQVKDTLEVYQELTLFANLDANDNRIKNLKDPVDPKDAVNMRSSKNIARDAVIFTCNGDSRDPDGDGLYEDVNGDGSVDWADPTLLFNGVFNNYPLSVSKFDFNGDGSVLAGDATVLANEISSVSGSISSATDPDGDGLFEDVNGDGVVSLKDPQLLFEEEFQSDVTDTKFDFNGDGSVNGGDATVLHNDVLSSPGPRYRNCEDIENTVGSTSTTSNSLKTPLRFTRGTIAYDASTSNKDSLCESEFGSNWETARLIEVGVYGKGKGTYNNLNRKINAYTDKESFKLDQAITATTGGTYPLACIKESAPLRFTRTTVSTSDSVSTKDSKCQASFGTSYRVPRVHSIVIYTGKYNFNNNVDKAHNFNSYSSSQSYYIKDQIYADSQGNYKLACLEN